MTTERYNLQSWKRSREDEYDYDISFGIKGRI